MNEINKALTFSYDDGVTQDKKLIEIFNKYGLKGTFNLNSGLLGKSGELLRDGVNVNHTKINPQDVKYVYEGHEVAVHTVTHPRLAEESDAEIVRQVERDREKLSCLAGYEVKGMAYPAGSRDRRVVEVVKNNTGVKYARSTKVTYNFNPSEEMFEYCGTLYHHGDWDKLFEIGEDFLKLEAKSPQIMYIWGHAYEFDIFPDRWKKFEEFCEMMGKRNDIFYGTNIEVFQKFGLI